MNRTVAIFLALAILSTATATATSTATVSSRKATDISDSVEKFYKNLNKQTLVLSKLKYYIHAHFGVGPDQTVHEVARCELTHNSTSNFGRILIVDNKLTTRPDPNSQKVGQYQGLNAYSDFREAAANMKMNIIFTDGDYKGSTIHIMGRQPVYEEVRVLSVVGGTGAFRFAQGTVLARTYSSDPDTKIGVYLYDMFVVTPVGGGIRVL